MKTALIFLALALTAVAAFVTSCNTEPASVTWSLTGTTWKLVELNADTVGGLRLPELVLDSNGYVARGTTGLNSFSGSYTLQAQSLNFSPFAATRRAGSSSEMKLESDYLQALGRVTFWKIEGKRLVLSAGSDIVARFQGMPGSSASHGSTAKH
jgi:heat shock protein HslJ